MKDFVTLALILLSVFIAIPCLGLGAFGLAGSLVDASHSENVKFAVPYLVIATVILFPSTICVWLRVKSCFASLEATAQAANKTVNPCGGSGGN